MSILPYIEQTALYEQINPQAQPGIFDPVMIAANYNGATMVPGGNVPVQAYLCPSSALPMIVPDFWLVPGAPGNVSVPAPTPTAIGYATSNYKPCGGSNAGDFGMMHKNSEGGGVRFRDVTDGLSNTVMVNESTYASSNVNRSQRATVSPSEFRVWPIWIGTGGQSDETVGINGRFNSLINGRVSFNKMALVINDDCAFSFHVGGAQFALGDGSVRFVSENVDTRTYDWLHDKCDGQPLGDFELHAPLWRLHETQN